MEIERDIVPCIAVLLLPVKQVSERVFLVPFFDFIFTNSTLVPLIFPPSRFMPTSRSRKDNVFHC